jgi:MFS family permease
MDMQRDGIAPNAGRLLWAGFFAILAAGIGFGIRANIAGQWRADFGFTDEQIGTIGPAMFPGFCFGIITGGLLCDRLGYGKLVVVAFALHLLSAVSAFGASTGDAAGALQVLWWGTFLFGFANGTLEAVANPLVATLFPSRRTHYLNILHASWPAGLMVGSLIVLLLPGWDWRVLLTMFLVATLAYGYLFFGQAMPKSEATRSGLGFGGMFKDVGILGALVICLLLSQFFAATFSLPQWAGYSVAGVLVVVAGVATNFAIGSVLLFVLFLTHLLIGAVELGTDFWAPDITENLTAPQFGTVVFLWTSSVMFALRFCAGWIERCGLSPVGLLMVSAVVACLGLNLASGMETLGGAILAMGVYAIGKTFFWPTMLAVASDRFPRTGAVAISLMGGIGMLSAGIVGGPGLGYAKDRFSGEELLRADAAVHAKYVAQTQSQFLMFDQVKGIDGKKRAEVQGRLKEVRGDLVTTQAVAKLGDEDRKVMQASLDADRKTLRIDSLIPATMAGIFLLLVLWFRSQGGYRVLRIGKDGEVEAAPPSQHSG